MFSLPPDRVCVMGIINVTPDSFSDGGLHLNAPEAIAAGLRMAEEGADLVDVGGESTRPGAEPVPAEEEARRVLPIIRALAKQGVAVSVDTAKPAVAREALRAGARVINDVTGLRDPEMRRVAAQTGATVCIMHMQGEPRTMQANPTYRDVVGEVCDFLSAQADLAKAGGVSPDRIWVDPGIGFGKSLEHNVALLGSLAEIKALGYPAMVGVSRKSFIGALTGVKEPSERLAGSLAAGIFAVFRGADVLRVHEVRRTVEALRVWMALGPS